jgi:hypothetical protein
MLNRTRRYKECLHNNRGCCRGLLMYQLVLFVMCWPAGLSLELEIWPRAFRAEQGTAVNYWWPSPAQLFLVSGPIESHDQISLRYHCFTCFVMYDTFSNITPTSEGNLYRISVKKNNNREPWGSWPFSDRFSWRPHRTLQASGQHLPLHSVGPEFIPRPEDPCRNCNFAELRPSKQTQG